MPFSQKFYFQCFVTASVALLLVTSVYCLDLWPGDPIDHLREKASQNPTMWGNGIWFSGQPGAPPPPEQLLAEVAPHIIMREGKVTRYTFLKAKNYGYGSRMTYILFESNLGLMIVEVASNDKDWSWRPFHAE